MSDNTLLVEGEADRGFFEALCRSLGLDTRVLEVAPPRRFGARRDTKQAVLNTLPTLLENLMDREGGRLAVVVDADSHRHVSLTIPDATVALAGQPDPLQSSARPSIGGVMLNGSFSPWPSFTEEEAEAEYGTRPMLR